LRFIGGWDRGYWSPFIGSAPLCNYWSCLQAGAGFLESIYRNALNYELRRRGLQVAAEEEVVVRYDGIEVGRHRLDLLRATSPSITPSGHYDLCRDSHPIVCQ